MGWGSGIKGTSNKDNVQEYFGEIIPGLATGGQEGKHVFVLRGVDNFKGGGDISYCLISLAKNVYHDSPCKSKFTAWPGCRPRRTRRASP